MSQQQRKLPSKRYSSYMPPTELSTLGDHVSSLPESSGPGVTMRAPPVSTPEKVLRRKNVNTLHFDALQNAVSKLSRIDDFDLEELGYGFFSDVFKVTHKQSGKVMVLKRNRSTNTKLNILREVQLMNRLSHPNILKFMGVCVHEGQLHGLTEYINGGDLDQLVEQNNTILSWTVRIRLAMDISKGLSYLHSMGIFHRDLTAKNCLVRVVDDNIHKKKYTAVVADLGLAEKIPTKPGDEERLRVVGTPYCMAPEVLCGKPYNERSDFFSFGIIICQLIIRTSSDPEKLPRSNDFGLQRDLFTILVKKGVGAPEAVNGTLPLSMPPNAFLQLAFDCCEVDPSKRPGIKEIICRLEQTSNEEKMKRIEKKKMMLKNVQGPMKRHSIVLSDIPSMTSFIEVSSPNKTSANTLSVPDSDKENTPSIESINTDKISSNSINLRRRSSGSSISARLSRSSSDVSNELISHAASIIASSKKKFLSDVDQSDDMSLVVSSLNNAFINPFSTLENSELQEKKLFDLPSSEVMEMTFDLPTPRVSSGSPPHSRRARSRPRSGRPKSLLLDVGQHELPHYFNDPLSPRAVTPEPQYESRKLSNLFGTSEESSTGLPPSCPTSPLPPIIYPDQRETIHGIVKFQTQLKQSLIRSMALSPQGRRLLSWWHNHGRATDWRSLTSVLSVMTEKLGTLRRSISVPDLSQDASSLLALSHSVPTSGSSSRSSISSEKGSPRSSISGKPPSGINYHPNVYPAYVTLPRKKKSTRCQSASADFSRKRRSRTSDDVFHDQTLLEILHEETSDSRQNSCPASTLKHCVESAPGCIQSSVNLSLSEINNNSLKNMSETEVGEGVTCSCLSSICSDGDAAADGDCLGTQMASCRLGMPPDTSLTHVDGSVSSSSSSSGTSSTGLRMTLYSGMVSTTRRRRIGIMSPPPPGCGPPSSWSLDKDSLSYHNHNHFVDSLRRTSIENPLRSIDPLLEDHCPGGRSDFVPRSNRDSGYNEELVFSADHSCDSQSSHDTADSGIRSRSAASLKSVSFTNPVCAALDINPITTQSNTVRPLSEYMGEIIPHWKIRDGSDSPITLVGKSH